MLRNWRRRRRSGSDRWIGSPERGKQAAHTCRPRRRAGVLPRLRRGNNSARVGAPARGPSARRPGRESAVSGCSPGSGRRPARRSEGRSARTRPWRGRARPGPASALPSRRAAAVAGGRDRRGVPGPVPALPSGPEPEPEGCPLFGSRFCPLFASHRQAGRARRGGGGGAGVAGWWGGRREGGPGRRGRGGAPGRGTIPGRGSPGRAGAGRSAGSGGGRTAAAMGR